MAFVREALHGVSARGGDPQRLLADAGIAPSLLVDLQGRVSAAAFGIGLVWVGIALGVLLALWLLTYLWKRWRARQASNKLEGVADGLTLTLSQETTAAVEVTVAPYTAAVQKSIETFVSAFNDVNAGRDLTAGRDIIAGDDLYVTDNLGIGLFSDAPAGWPDGYRLAVDGNIICEEVRVELQAAWPDYVFHTNYELMSLADLEKSIQQNGHLPNVPTAQTVETEGMQLGEMQRIVMEKIEELTLYTIQQQKELEQLKTENEELRSLISSMAKRN